MPVKYESGTGGGGGGGTITGGGSATQVAFWTGATSIGGDNDFWWDNVNKRVGILTNTPTEDFHLAGDSLITGHAAIGSALTAADPDKLLLIEDTLTTTDSRGFSLHTIFAPGGANRTHTVSFNRVSIQKFVNSYGNIRGVYSEISSQNDLGGTDLVVFDAYSEHIVNGGIINQMFGLRMESQKKTATSDVLNMYGTYYVTPLINGVGSTTTVYAHFVEDLTGLNGTAQYAFFYDTAIPWVVQGNGFQGIGTTTPGTFFHIDATNNSEFIRLEGTGDSVGIYAGSIDPNGVVSAQAGSTYHRFNGTIWVNDSGAMVWSQLGSAGATCHSDIYGDGSDGTVTISVDTMLTRDMFYDSLTIDDTFTLNTNGYRVHVLNDFNWDGIVALPGNDGMDGTDGEDANIGGPVANGGVGGAGGAGLDKGSIVGFEPGAVGADGAQGTPQNNNAGIDGGSGGTGIQRADDDVDWQIGSDGSDAGSGGAGGEGTTATPGTLPGGAAGGFGTGLAQPFPKNTPHTTNSAWLQMDFAKPNGVDTAWVHCGSSGSGGGGGGGAGGVAAEGAVSADNASGGGGAGGGAGSAGGIVAIYARSINFSATGVANVSGGDGGNGGNAGISVASGGDRAAGGSGGGGGGAGGPGGVLILVYETFSNAGTINLAGGTGGTAGLGAAEATTGTGTGTAGADGVVGNNGNTGVQYEIQTCQ